MSTDSTRSAPSGGRHHSEGGADDVDILGASERSQSQPRISQEMGGADSSWVHDPAPLPIFFGYFRLLVSSGFMLDYD